MLGKTTTTETFPSRNTRGSKKNGSNRDRSDNNSCPTTYGRFHFTRARPVFGRCRKLQLVTHRAKVL